MTIAAPYQNSGNDLVLSLIPADLRSLLDIGCGAGDNARRLRMTRPDIRIVGLTHSTEEASMAAPFMSAVHVLDIEHEVTAAIGGPFDVLLFSHVLEHVREPLSVIRRFLTLLSSGGHVLIAVPNTLEWRTRLGFLRGQFKYTDAGILDRTHLRFFTYETAVAELIDPLPELRLITRRGRGAAPFGLFRRRLLPARLHTAIDEIAVRRQPNLFAGEVALLARYEP